MSRTELEDHASTWPQPETVAEIDVEFPGRVDDRIGQDQEWCILRAGMERRRVRFHDYHEIYQISGLYEHLFYERLKCCSPRVVCDLLADQMARASAPPSALRVLDVGAGNGMVGQRLAELGAGHLIGVDIIQEAAEAAWRDRPGVYDAYFVVDLTDVPPGTALRLTDARLNCLVSVAALGFGDIPPLAFANAYNLIASPGWVAFNIKEAFLDIGNDSSGFCRLIRRMVHDGTMDLRIEQRYRHRLSITGRPLLYHAMVGIKRADIPDRVLEDLAAE